MTRISPRSPALRVALLGCLAAAAIVSYDLATYTLRLRSQLQPAVPRPCPPLAELASRTDLPSAAEPSVVVDRRLEYACDTRAYLAALFAAVTGDASDDLARGMAWVKYIQTTIRSTAPALDADGNEIVHPLWLLEHRYLQCGQNARLVVDGFMAAGIPARVLQLNGHVAAEFHAAGKWRFVDADLLAGGEFVTDGYGDAASIDDILRNPALLHAHSPYAELTADVEQVRQTYQAVFEPTVYDESPLTTPYVIRKAAPRLPPQLIGLRWLNGRLARDAARRTTHAYGWNYYVLCSRQDPRCTN